MKTITIILIFISISTVILSNAQEKDSIPLEFKNLVSDIKTGKGLSKKIITKYSGIKEEKGDGNSLDYSTEFTDVIFISDTVLGLIVSTSTGVSLSQSLQTFSYNNSFIDYLELSDSRDQDLSSSESVDLNSNFFDNHIIETILISWKISDSSILEKNGQYKEGYEFDDGTVCDTILSYYKLLNSGKIIQISKDTVSEIHIDTNLIKTTEVILEDIKFKFDNLDVDTSNLNVFIDKETTSNKIYYFHSDGFSSFDRYWYEVIIIDSLLVLNFQSPILGYCKNNIIFQKQTIIEDSILNRILTIIKVSGLKQKKIGIPMPVFSEHTLDRLFIETSNIKIFGGTVCNSWIHRNENENQATQRKKMERELSTTISGDFDLVFDELKNLFTELNDLIKDMKNR